MPSTPPANGRPPVLSILPRLAAAAFLFSTVLTGISHAKDDRCPFNGNIPWGNTGGAAFHFVEPPYFWDYLVAQRVTSRTEWPKLTADARCAAYKENEPKAWGAYQQLVKLRLETDPQNPKLLGKDLDERVKKLEEAKARVEKETVPILDQLGTQNPDYRQRLQSRRNDLNAMIEQVSQSARAKAATQRAEKNLLTGDTNLRGKGSAATGAQSARGEQQAAALAGEAVGEKGYKKVGAGAKGGAGAGGKSQLTESAAGGGRLRTPDSKYAAMDGKMPPPSDAHAKIMEEPKKKKSFLGGLFSRETPGEAKLRENEREISRLAKQQQDDLKKVQKMTKDAKALTDADTANKEESAKVDNVLKKIDCADYPEVCAPLQKRQKKLAEEGDRIVEKERQFLGKSSDLMTTMENMTDRSRKIRELEDKAAYQSKLNAYNDKLEELEKKEGKAAAYQYFEKHPAPEPGDFALDRSGNSWSSKMDVATPADKKALAADGRFAGVSRSLEAEPPAGMDPVKREKARRISDYYAKKIGKGEVLTKDEQDEYGTVLAIRGMEVSRAVGAAPLPPAKQEKLARFEEEVFGDKPIRATGASLRSVVAPLSNVDFVRDSSGRISSVQTSGTVTGDAWKGTLAEDYRSRIMQGKGGTQNKALALTAIEAQARNIYLMEQALADLDPNSQEAAALRRSIQNSKRMADERYGGVFK